MVYLVERLQQLLKHYRQLPEAAQNSGDSLKILEALKEVGEPINLIEYNSETLQLSTVTVENLVSFTEKLGPGTSLRAANQLLDFIQSLIRLLNDFSESECFFNVVDKKNWQYFWNIYPSDNSLKKSHLEIVETLKKLNDDLIYVYEAPYCVTIEIKKVVSFTAKSKTKSANCIEDAARDMVNFLEQLAKVNWESNKISKNIK